MTIINYHRISQCQRRNSTLFSCTSDNATLGTTHYKTTAELHVTLAVMTDVHKLQLYATSFLRAGSLRVVNGLLHYSAELRYTFVWLVRSPEADTEAQMDMFLHIPCNLASFHRDEPSQ